MTPLDANAINIVKDPTLPININSIINIFPKILRFGLPPILSPTVAIADTTSNPTSSKLKSGSVIDIIRVPIKNRATPIKNIPNDFFTVVSLILLSHTSISCFSNINDFTVNINVAIVVVFTPPPVDAGDAPININIIIKNILFSLIAAKSIVLNPAVLSVTDWNSDANIFPPNPN